MIYKTVNNYFEKHPNVSYLFFACVIFSLRVFLHRHGDDAQLFHLSDVTWTLILTAGFMAGDRIRRKNKATKDKIENELNKK